MIRLMRKCGHFLHHSAGEGEDSKKLLSALSDQEIRELAALLEKCTRNW
ncbi:MAG: hypothetical protein SOZ59_14140 [Candidatus Limivivens sp.]|nr:hypothetical protein [Candidatus Limivivens sp.]